MFGGIVGDTVFRLAGSIDVEQGRPAAVQALDIAFQQMGNVGDRTLHHIGVAVGHANQSDFLADLRLALPDLAEARHVRDLAGESRGAGLAAGIGIDLGIQYQHLDGHLRHQRP